MSQYAVSDILTLHSISAVCQMMYALIYIYIYIYQMLQGHTGYLKTGASL